MRFLIVLFQTMQGTWIKQLSKEFAAINNINITLGVILDSTLKPIIIDKMVCNSSM